MTVTRNENNDIVITLPGDLDPHYAQRLINYFEYREAVRHSTGTQEDVDELVAEFKKGWWEKNKHRFIPDEVTID